MTDGLFLYIFGRNLGILSFMIGPVFEPQVLS